MGVKRPSRRTARRALERAEAARRARVGAELERSGANARAAAVAAILGNPFFERCLQTAITKTERVAKPTNEEDVRQIVLRVLREDFGRDPGDVVIKVFWMPKTKQLRLSAHPGVEASLQAVEIATAATAAKRARAAALDVAAGRSA